MLVCWMSLLRTRCFMITIGKMAMQSTIIAVNLHVIPHFHTNELWHACISHNCLFEKHVFIRKVKGHECLR